MGTSILGSSCRNSGLRKHLVGGLSARQSSSSLLAEWPLAESQGDGSGEVEKDPVRTLPAS